MSELTRYEPYQPWWDGIMSMDAVPNGQWVRYEDALSACAIARRDEREQIAQFVESMDAGFVADELHITATIAEAIRAMPKEANNDSTT